MRIRVLTYNIHKGMNATNTLEILASVKAAIDLVNAEVVFLQEVFGDHASITHTQLEKLADKVWPHFAYGQNSVYTKGHHGNAILSKYPILSHENINISTNTMEKRGLLHSSISVEGVAMPVHLFCLHLSLFGTGRKKQFEKISARIAQSVPPDAPLIIGGDFNDWSESFTLFEDVHKVLHGRHAKTFPSFFPVLCLDRIYFRGMKPLQSEALTGEPWKRLSDHGALFAEFEI